MRAGETQGEKDLGSEGSYRGSGECRGESWRVVEYLHAQSLFTLHQAAAEREREMER